MKASIANKLTKRLKELKAHQAWRQAAKVSPWKLEYTLVMGFPVICSDYNFTNNLTK